MKSRDRQRHGGVIYRSIFMSHKASIAFDENKYGSTSDQNIYLEILLIKLCFCLFLLKLLFTFITEIFITLFSSY